MKKILFIMPLMALTTITSCGKPIDPNKIDLYKKAYVYESDGKTVFSTTTYTYNEQSLVAEEVTSYEGSTQVEKYNYIYDEHENVREATKTTYIDGEITQTDTCHMCNEYDKQGRLTHSYCTDPNPTFETVEATITYGDHTKLVDKITRDPRFTNYGEIRGVNLYTYNDKGHVINEKYFRKVVRSSNDDYFTNEIVYELDQNECATSIKEYKLAPTGERESLENEMICTYLNNLYYRLKRKITLPCYEGRIMSTMVEEFEYDEQNRQTLYKFYEVNSEGYWDYITYEY